MLCSRLRANGIDAFVQGASVSGGPTPGLPSLSPTLPAEVWVDEADIEQARQFLPDHDTQIQS
jgi:hypothetical protein